MRSVTEKVKVETHFYMICDCLIKKAGGDGEKWLRRDQGGIFSYIMPACHPSIRCTCLEKVSAHALHIWGSTLALGLVGEGILVWTLPPNPMSN